MKFELLIENDFPIPNSEIARILRSISPANPYGKISDVNGNVIGAWTLDNPELKIEIYPMCGNTLANYHSEVTSWDVLLCLDGSQQDPLEEYECLSRDEVDDRIRILRSQYPEARVDTQMEDLLL